MSRHPDGPAVAGYTSPVTTPADDGTGSESFALPADATAAGIARGHARRLLRRWSLGSLVEPVSLVVSELVGNAVRHGAPLPTGGIRVGWTIGPDVIRIEVADGGRGPLRHEHGAHRAPLLVTGGPHRTDLRNSFCPAHAAL